ncbi:MAG: protease inhibitor I42 family protein [Chloroflexota bacterium]
MKKIPALIMVSLLIVSLVAGCSGGAKTYSDSGQTITTSLNREFIIALDSNPTTGYRWEASYDENRLSLVENTFQPGEGTEKGMVGAGGTELFRFRAQSRGETEISMVYKRPWEEKSEGQITRVFKINTE